MNTATPPTSTTSSTPNLPTDDVTTFAKFGFSCKNAAWSWINDTLKARILSKGIITEIDIQISVILNSIARNYGIPCWFMVPLVKYISKSLQSQDNEVITKLCETVKHAANKYAEDNTDPDKKLTTILLEKIWKGILNVKDKESKSQLTMAISKLLPEQGLKLSQEILVGLSNITGINDNAKQMLMIELSKMNSSKRTEIDFENLNIIGQGIGKMVIGSTTSYLTISQTHEYSTSIDFQSEKTTLKIINLLDNFKTLDEREKQRHEKSVLDPKKEEGLPGSKLHWWNFKGTPENVEYFYNLISKGEKLTESDVNDYLCNRFLAKHYFRRFCFIGHSLKVNLKIAQIFLLYSKSKFELKEEILTKLFVFLKNAPVIHNKKFISKFVSDKLALSSDDFDNCDLHTMRYYVLDTIYHQSRLFGVQVILTEERQGIVTNFLEACKDDKTNSDRDYNNGRKVANDILGLCKNLPKETKYVQAREHLKTLKNDGPTLSRDEICKIVREIDLMVDKETEGFFLEDNNQGDIVSLIIDPGQSSLVRIGCLDVLQNYLTFSKCGYATLSSGEKLLSSIHSNHCDDLYLGKLLKVILLMASEKQVNPAERCMLASQIFTKLVPLISSLKNTNQVNSIMVTCSQILENLIKSGDVIPEIIITPILFNKILDKAEIGISARGEIVFENIKNSEKYMVSAYAANFLSLYLKSIEISDKDLTITNLKTLITCLVESKDKQTRICVSEILFHLHKKLIPLNDKKTFSEEEFRAMKDLSMDSVQDVKFHCLAVFIHMALAYSSTLETNLFCIHRNDFFSPLNYFFSDEICLNGKDISKTSVKEPILKMLKILAKKAPPGFEFSNLCYKIFEQILDIGDKKYYLKDVIDTLEFLAQKKKSLHSDTLHSMENVVSHDRVMNIFSLCIKNGQVVPVTVINILAQKLHGIEDDKERRETFDLLELANKRQEFEDEAYFTLQMEIALRSPLPSTNQVQSGLKYISASQKVNSRSLTISNFVALHQLLEKKEMIKESLEILVTAGEIMQEFPSKFRSTVEDILIGKILQKNMDIFFLPNICKIINHLLNKNYAIPSKSQILLKEKLQELLLKVVAFREKDSHNISQMFQICAFICRKEKVKMSNDTLLLLIKEIRTSHFNEHCIKNLIPVLAEMTTFLMAPVPSDEVIKEAIQLFLDLIKSNSIENYLIPRAFSALKKVALCYPGSINGTHVEELVLIGEKSEEIELNKQILEMLQNPLLKIILNTNLSQRMQFIVKDLNITLEICLEKIQDEFGPEQINQNRLRILLKPLPNLLLTGICSQNTKKCRKDCLFSKATSMLRDILDRKLEIIIPQDIIHPLIISLSSNCGSQQGCLILQVLQSMSTISFTLEQAEILCSIASSSLFVSGTYTTYLENILKEEENEEMNKISSESRNRILTRLSLRKTLIPENSQESTSVNNFLGALKNDPKCKFNTIEMDNLVEEGQKLNFEQNEISPSTKTYIDLLSILTSRGEFSTSKAISLSIREKYERTFEQFAKATIHQKGPLNLHWSVLQTFCTIVKQRTEADLDITIYWNLLPKLVKNCGNQTEVKIRHRIHEFVNIMLGTCLSERITQSDAQAGVKLLETGLKSEDSLIRYLSVGGILSVCNLLQDVKWSPQFLKWCTLCKKNFPSLNGLDLDNIISSSKLFHSLSLITTANLIEKDLEPLLKDELIQLFNSSTESGLSKVIFIRQIQEIVPNLSYQSLNLAIKQDRIKTAQLPSIIKAIKHIPVEMLFNTLENSFTPSEEIFEMALINIIKRKCPQKMETDYKSKIGNEAKRFFVTNNFEFSQLSKFIGSIKSIENLDDFLNLLKFMEQYPHHLNHFETFLDKAIINSPVDALIQFQINQSIRQIFKSYPNKGSSQSAKLRQLFQDLYQKGFNFDQITDFLAKVVKKFGDPVKESTLQGIILPFLRILNQFNVCREKQEISCKIMQKFIEIVETYDNYGKWVQFCNFHLVRNLFEETFNAFKHQKAQQIVNPIIPGSFKSLKEIIKQFVQKNKEISKEICIGWKLNHETEMELEKSLFQLMTKLEKIEEVRPIYKSTHNFVAVPKKLEEWKINDYTTWKSKIREEWKENVNEKQQLLLDSLAVMMQATKKVYNFNFTYSQILSCLLVISRISKNPDKGLLQQVVTGGGKSAIIRVVAALIHILNDTKVFIATSNSVLAERDARLAGKLFDLFSITKDHNKDKQRYITGEKRCYKFDVVFGEASQFQFDVLRHEFAGLGTYSLKMKSKVDFSSVAMIVDEVDSMFIDDCSKFTRLASQFAGMDLLEMIYHFVWRKLLDIQGRIFSVFNGEKLFCALGHLTRNTGTDSYSLEYITSDGKDRKLIEDIQDYLEKSKNIEEEEMVKEIKQSIPQFIQTHLENCLKGLVKNEAIKGYEMKKDQKMKIPKHLKDFVTDHINIWPQSAVAAMFHYQERIHYIVDDKMIKPVEHLTNGMIRANQHWSDGLHQFIQLKHNLALTQETLASNFLSTVTFFNRFEKRNLHGFTATFGSKPAKKFMSSVFQVDLVKIPSLINKRFHKFDDIHVKSRKEWEDAILDTVFFETLKNRAVLIVCSTIKEAEMVFKCLQKHFPNKSNNELKLYTRNDKNLESSVETAKQGDIIVATNLAGRGTDIRTNTIIEENGGLHICITFMPSSKRAEKQLIGRTSRHRNGGTAQFILLEESESMSANLIRAQRDQEEEKTLSTFETISLPIIKRKDKMMEEVCKILSDLREAMEGTRVCKIFGKSVPIIVQRSVLSSIEEEWALINNKMENAPYNSTNLFNEFKTSIQGRTNDLNNLEKIITSPFHATVVGNYYTQLRDYKTGLKYYERAEKLDEFFCTGAHIGKAWCYVSALNKCKSENPMAYKREVVSELEKALELLSIENSVAQTAYTLTQNQWKNGELKIDEPNNKSDLELQLINRITIINNYANYFQSSLTSVIKSQRRVGIKYISNEDKIVREFKNGITRENKLVPTNSSIKELVFHGLTNRFDIGKKDQALDIMKKYMTQTKHIDKSFKNVRIVASSDKCDSLRNLLDKKSTRAGLTQKETLVFLRGEGYISKAKKKVASLMKFKSGIIEYKVYDANNNLLHAREGDSDAEIISHIENLTPGNNSIDLSFDNTKIHNAIAPATFNLTLKNFDTKSTSQFSQMVKGKSLLLQVTGNQMNLKNFVNEIPQKEFTNFSALRIENPNEEVKRIIHEKIKPQDSIKEDNLIGLELGLKSSTLKLLLKETIHHPLSFAVTIHDLDVDDVLVMLALHRNKSVELEIKTNVMNKMTPILKILREANYEVNVKIINPGIGKHKICQLFSILAEEDLKIENRLIKKLSSLYMEGSEPPEIFPLIQRGLEYLVVFSEKKFIPWTSMMVVCTIGAVQIAIGTAMVLSAFGAPIGIAIITEGMVDLLTGVKICYMREFTWKDYAFQKTISLAISCTTLGLGAFKELGHGFQAVFSATGTEAIEQVGVQILRGTLQNPQNSIQLAKQCLVNLKNLVLPHAGVILAETVARECIFTASEAVSDFLLENYESTIASSVSSKLFQTSTYTDLSQQLDGIEALHEMFGIQRIELENKIENILRGIVYSQDTTFGRALSSAGSRVACSLTSGNLRSGITLLTTLGSFIYGSVEILQVLEIFCGHIFQELKQYEVRQLSLASLIQKKCNLDGGETTENSRSFANYLCPLICCGRELQSFSFIEAVNECPEEQLVEIIQNVTLQKLIGCNLKEESISIANVKLINLVKGFKQKVMKLDKKSFYDRHPDISKQIVDTITNQIIGVSKTYLIRPASGLAANIFVKQVSNYVQSKFIVKSRNNSPQQKVQDEQFDKLMETKLKGGKLSENEETFISNYQKPLTLYCQIMQNAADFKIAHQFYILTRTGTSTSKKETKSDNTTSLKYTEMVKSGKNGKIAELSHISSGLNINVILVDGKVEENQLAEIRAAHPDSHIIKIVGDRILQFSLLDSSGKPIINSDCSYKILNKITNKPESELRGIFCNEMTYNWDQVGPKILAEMFLTELNYLNSGRNSWSDSSSWDNCKQLASQGAGMVWARFQNYLFIPISQENVESTGTILGPVEPSPLLNDPINKNACNASNWRKRCFILFLVFISIMLFLIYLLRNNETQASPNQIKNDKSEF